MKSSKLCTIWFWKILIQRCVKLLILFVYDKNTSVILCTHAQCQSKTHWQHFLNTARAFYEKQEWFAASICGNGWNVDSLLDTSIEITGHAVGRCWFFSSDKGKVNGVGFLECGRNSVNWLCLKKWSNNLRLLI